ncbi:MAG: MucB/RseB C-terminal domain-containing protein [Rhodoferax sp.]|uniref:MucB/RseB C-terminal domain-containing protein n=1 Tax=Rhodoferax sp. TaxID=50421 RepID=UPI002730ADEC|nr:MucB/RseB C-terminal domain-containing protein [Rhodoferax sp.]MDP1530108.1 MucB/RseB C-terminal domain-containing protein [Rhodoferax sp.]MDP1943472.1 MucB/RseB C-terminal domain-containing protein [Rhodoferax sp.]
MSRLAVVFFGLVFSAGLTWAQGDPGPLSVKIQPRKAEEAPISRWLVRLHEAARQRSYVGTFVVTAGDTLSSSRIWHVCDGQQQMERIDALTGESRTTFRRNDQVATFLPERRLVIAETRESFGLFPNLLNRADSSIARYYGLKPLGQDRVAGLVSDVVQLVPVDALRYGYKVWTHRETGVVLKLQTLDAGQGVLEQAAFSELQLGEPVSMASLVALMNKTEGFKVLKPELRKTSAAQEGWSFKGHLAGFESMACHQRVSVSASQSRPHANTLQWVFSDGLASVSLFIEKFDVERHGHLTSHESLARGATRMLTRRLDDWWVTAVGEVPAQTLAFLAKGLERTR